MSEPGSESEGTRFDFAEARRRLREEQRAGDDAHRLSQLFAERAALLARPAQAAHQHEGGTHLAFATGAVRFAVSLTSIRAVLVPRHVVAIPGAPLHLAEVMHFDGRIVSLLSLPLLLGEQAGASDGARDRQVVVLGSGSCLLGVPASATLGLVAVDPQRLLPSLHNGGFDFVLGIADHMTLVLDGPRLVETLRSRK